MSVASQELVLTILAAMLFAVATVTAIREEAKAFAWLTAVAFFACSFLAAWLLWRSL